MSESAAHSSNPFQFSLAWLLAYITFMALVSGGVAYGRWQAFKTYGTTDAKSAWILWRAEVEQSQGQGSVARRVPKSTEPPALVLMRDHFVACLTVSLLLTSVLFGTFMVFIRGAFATQIQPQRK